MSENQGSRLPVLFVTDLVVLPGMVVPLELDESSQAAIDAARSSSDGRLLVAPRLEDRYASYGVIASVERVGRFSGGAPAAVLKAEQRARIGSGVTGPGAALWVEAEPVPYDPEQVSEHARELAEEYKRLVVAVLQRREAWQVIDSVHQMTDPSRHRRRGRLRAVPHQRPQARAARDARRRGAARDPHRLDPRASRGGRGRRQDR